MAPSMAVPHRWALLCTRQLSQQASPPQAAVPRDGHHSMGWPLGVLWASRDRNVSLVQSDAHTENVKEEATEHEVRRGNQRTKDKGC